MKLPKVADETRPWCGLLEEEMSAWPRVRSRPMFGMLAFYRGKRIFAALPRTRAAETEFSLLIKLPGKHHERLRSASGPGAGWVRFELQSPEEIAEALRWLHLAYETAGIRSRR